MLEAILLDLRGNLGGDKDEALRILGYFLGRTVVLKIRYAGSQPKIYQTLTDKVYWCLSFNPKRLANVPGDINSYSRDSIS